MQHLVHVPLQKQKLLFHNAIYKKTEKVYIESFNEDSTKKGCLISSYLTSDIIYIGYIDIKENSNQDKKIQQKQKTR